MRNKMRPDDPKLHEYLRSEEVGRYVMHKALIDPEQRLEVDIPVETVREVVDDLRQDFQVLLESVVGYVAYKQFLDVKRYGFLNKATANEVDVRLTSVMLARVLVGMGIAHVVTLPEGKHVLAVPHLATDRGWYESEQAEQKRNCMSKEQ